MKKRIIATLLALVMCIGLLPVTALAGGDVSGPKPNIKNVTYTNENPPRVKVEFANGEGRTWFELYAIKEWKEGDPDAIGKLSIDGKMYAIVGIQSIDPEMDGVYQTTAGTTILDFSLYIGSGQKPAEGEQVGIVVEAGDNNGYNRSDITFVTVPAEGKSVMVGDPTGGEPIVCDHVGTERIYIEYGAIGHGVRCGKCGKTIVQQEAHTLTITAKNEYQHTESCSLCGYTRDVDHNWVYSNREKLTHDEYCPDCKLKLTGVLHTHERYECIDGEKHRWYCPCTMWGDEEHAIPSDATWNYKNTEVHSTTCTVCGGEATHGHRFGGSARKYTRYEMLRSFPKPQWLIYFTAKCKNCTAVKEGSTTFMYSSRYQFLVDKYLKALIKGQIPQSWLELDSRGENGNIKEQLAALTGQTMIDLGVNLSALYDGSELEWIACNVIDNEALHYKYDEEGFKVYNGAGKEVKQKNAPQQKSASRGAFLKSMRAGGGGGEGDEGNVYDGWWMGDDFDDSEFFSWTGESEAVFVLNGSIIQDLSDGWHTYTVFVEGYDPELGDEADSVVNGAVAMQFLVVSDDEGNKSIGSIIYPEEDDVSNLRVELTKRDWPYGEAVYTYNGGECKPRATVSYCGKTLYEGTDYTLEYKKNVNAGTAYAVITALGDTFTGTAEVPFVINPADVNDINASVSTVVYNTKPQTPKVSLYTYYYDESNYQQTYYLTEGKDYEILGYANNVEAGTATVTVRGMGNFTGERAIEFTINPMPLYRDDYTVNYDKYVTYTGQPVNPIKSVVWKLTGETLVEGRDYTVQYYSSAYDLPNNENNDNHTDVQTGVEFSFNFIGNFSGSGYYYFDIIEPIDGTDVLPKEGTYHGMVWTIDKDGVMTVVGAADLSYHNDVAFRPYRKYIKKIILEQASVIYAGTFADCPYVTEIVLPDGLTSISYSVFFGCNSLQKLNIPATVTKLNAGTFPDVPGLEIHLPDNITSENFEGQLNFSDYGTKYFVNRGSATESALNASWSRYCYEGYPDYLLFRNPNYPEYGLELERYTGAGGTIVIPDFIDYVVGGGFCDTYRIEKLVIPGTVSKLGCIQNSYGLRELVIEPGNKLTETPSQFISGCRDITIYFPDNITSIGSPINYYTDSNMLIVANCNAYAIEWAKSQTSWGIPVWADESEAVSGPRYRMIHIAEHHDGKTPTCVEGGWAEYITCERCGFNGYRELPIDDEAHDWGEWTLTKAPTCDEEGVETRVCKRDPSHIETRAVPIDPEAHNWGEWEVTTPATYWQEGAERRLCLNNPEHVETRVIEKLLKGDSDGDGEITVADALMALRIAAKLAPETPEALAVADTDRDGRITVADALKILRVAAKLLSMDSWLA
ncbi:MAG: leucine-rich repeat protein [Clostridia bacterium]|nr:leucine-rich repeat protein [Clostridia bacterium]